MTTQFSPTPTIVPLGDQAALVYCADETAAVRLAGVVRNARFPWLLDLVPAYASVGLFFDADRIRFAEVAGTLLELPIPTMAESEAKRSHIIPCCYEMQLDLERVAEQTRLSPEEVIARHVEREYTVYAIGFAPGFPYLGYLPPELCGVPRLPTPRLRVEAGSVGLTGKQTGIYPQMRPGGWNLIGRTPIVLVDVEDGYFPLRVGDTVEFRRIDEAEFRIWDGKRTLPGRR